MGGMPMTTIQNLAGANVARLARNGLGRARRVVL